MYRFQKISVLNFFSSVLLSCFACSMTQVFFVSQVFSSINDSNGACVSVDPTLAFLPHSLTTPLQSAFDKLDSIFGTYTDKSEVKTGYQLPRHCMTNTDLNRIINSDEVCLTLWRGRIQFPQSNSFFFVC